jgi:hypothetical protein
MKLTFKPIWWWNQECVELYLHSPLVPSWHVQGQLDLILVAVQCLRAEYDLRVSSVHLWILAAISVYEFTSISRQKRNRVFSSTLIYYCRSCIYEPIPAGAWSKAWARDPHCWHCGSNPVGVMGVWCLSLVNVVSYQLEVSATIWSLVQRRPAECVCVCVCVSLGVIRCNNNGIHLQWLGRRGQARK